MSIFKKMVKLQHQFNKQVAEDYLDKNFNWNSAIIAESGELLDSLGYKWWKKQEPDMENVKVEAIDLLHFVISDTLQMNYDIRNFGDILNSTIRDFEVGFKEISINLKNSKLLKLIDLLNTDRLSRFIVMKAIFEKLEILGIKDDLITNDFYIMFGILALCITVYTTYLTYRDKLKIVIESRENKLINISSLLYSMLVFILIGYFWYSQRGFKRAFLKDTPTVLKTLSGIAVAVALYFFITKPIYPVKDSTETIIEGFVASSKPIKEIM